MGAAELSLQREEGVLFYVLLLCKLEASFGGKRSIGYEQMCLTVQLLIYECNNWYFFFLLC